MQRTSKPFPRLLGSLAVMAAGVFGAGNLAAQPFEYLYGPGTTLETSYHGVEEVNNCNGGGYISVGTSTTTAGASDIYVVRTNPNGTRRWEFTYDITPPAGGQGGNDMGYAIAELPGGGFVLTGSTDLGGPLTDIFLMWLDCNGAVTSCFTYASPPPVIWPGNWVGRDIMVTANGNIVVAGWTTASPSGTVDGMMLRTTAAGGPLWRIIYDMGSNDVLNGVTETVVGLFAGDIVAAGTFGGVQGWMMRTGPGGIIAGAPHGSAQIGGVGFESFNSVKEITANGVPGDLIFVGYTTSNTVAGLKDIYAVQTALYPCTIAGDRQVGDANGNFDDEWANDLVEITNTVNPVTFTAFGNLAVTGATTNNTGATEAFLLPLNYGNGLLPGPGFVYGDHASNPDEGFSINQTNSGVIIGGWSQFHPMNNTDPSDMYLVRTNAAGQTCCEQQWNPPSFIPGYSSTCLTPTLIQSPCEPVERSVVKTSRNTPIKACTVSCSFPKHGVDDGMEQIIENGMKIKLFPNPVAVDGSVTLTYPVEAGAMANVTVTNTLGDVVYTTTVDASGRELTIPLMTTGWGAGTYLIRVESGEDSDVIRMVVAE